MICQITSNITNACNRNIGGIKRIYLANGPLFAAYDVGGIIVALTLDGAPTYTPVGPWYTIETPRVTGQFTETYEINQANGTVVYNQELSFVSNTWDTTTREQIKRMAESTDMIVIFEDNNGKQWLMGEHHGVHMQTGTTESGLNYGDRNGHTIVLSARNPEPAQEVWDGATGGPTTGDPVDPAELGDSQSFVFESTPGMLPPLVYTQWTNRVPRSGWRTYYDTVTAARSNTWWAGYVSVGFVGFIGTNTPTVGAIAYNNLSSSPYYGYRLYVNGRGYVWRTSISAPSSTWRIVDFENGVITAVKNWSDYTCTKPDPLDNEPGIDPYYKIFYGYEYLGVETTWIGEGPGYDNSDAKAIIEAMPDGATPLYYRVIKTRGHVAITDPGPVIDKEGDYWPFPALGHNVWNYDTNLRSDIPEGIGYLFNHNNEWNLDPSQINIFFQVTNASSTGPLLYCPEVAGAHAVSGYYMNRYEDV